MHLRPRRAVFRKSSAQFPAGNNDFQYHPTIAYSLAEIVRAISHMNFCQLMAKPYGRYQGRADYKTITHFQWGVESARTGARTHQLPVRG